MNDLESYPPLFRENDSTPLNDDVVLNPESSDDDEIPIVDFKCLGLEKEGRHLHEVCKEWGVFRLVNHVIPLTLLSQLQDQTKRLFSLSFETKQKAFGSPPLSYFWGTPALTPSGKALSKGQNKNVFNRVEGFNVLLNQLPQFQPSDHMIDSFRLLLEEYREHLARLASTIFDVIVKNLNLDSNQAKEYLSESTGILRAYRYPKFLKAMEDHQMGLEIHTDSSVLSILNQDHVGGLEVLKGNKWFHVKPISGSLIVNLGDMMQAISNDEYISVKHRVKVNKHEERLSICYFVFPEEGYSVRSSNYMPFTYTDFRAQVQHDIKTVGFKVGLLRFKINP